ncbi:MAG: PACE efflux transporter [Pseudomonadota bacterium]|nr:PACE efflux transporter [Pseudomonadota bacterium]
MRSPLDRLRHALVFEFIALGLVVPLGAVLFHMPVHHIGVVGVVSATLATLWNMAYNLIFDLVLRWRRGTTEKSIGLRVVHALMFEAGLLTVLLPFMAWYLELTLWQALMMDLGFAGFYLVYAFAFNWAYDRLFPVPLPA